MAAKVIDEEDDSAPGWDAINKALSRVYGKGEAPFHYGNLIPAFLGGSDPLHGISVYVRDDPVPYWHFVTYGFTELFAKESKVPDESGFGFELTFRLIKNEKSPPPWALNFLQNLGRYVFDTGTEFAEAHYMSCQGSIAIGKKTDIRAIAFVKEPELRPASSPHGKFKFLQVVGITLDELALMRRWSTVGVLAAIKKTNPLFLTDLKRKSYLSDVTLAKKLDQRAKKDGSNTRSIFASEASFSLRGKKLRIVLGANAVRDIKELFVPRLGFDREFRVVSPEFCVAFHAGAELSWKKESKSAIEITVPKSQVVAISDALQPLAGEYALPACPNVLVEVRRSEIKDADGKIVEVIG